MKTYIIASNTDFTTICKAESVNDALLLAKGLFTDKYGTGADNIGLEAYEVSDYINDNECIEIDFKY